MEILIKTTIISYRTNKYQRGHSFRTDEKKGKKSIPRMGWFSASGTVEILHVRWQFIKRISKEEQVDWWIKLQKLRAFKEKDNNQVLYWYYIQKTLLFIQNILMPIISSHIHLSRISNINQTWSRTCRDKRRQHLKNRN